MSEPMLSSLPAATTGHRSPRAGRAAPEWRRVALGVLVLALAGCAVGPDYVSPQMSVAPAWHATLAGGATGERVDLETLASWWTTLNDPPLTSLVERGVRGSLDLKEAQARIREARARRGISAAGFFPTVTASSSATRTRSSRNAGGGGTHNTYSTGLDASWELDIFGGVRRSVEAAEMSLQASTEDLRNVLVSLIAEIALNYVDVRTLQARLTIVEANLRAQVETWELTVARFEAGLTTFLDVDQAAYNVASTRSQLPAIRSALEEAKNRLAVLLGEQPGRIHAELEGSRPIPTAPSGIAVGVPADTLRRRPDVRQAERKLAAQTAQIGVAEAELYPKLTLLGSIGLDALSLSNTFSAASRVASIGPTISWRLFDGGAIRKNIEVQSALQEQALIEYEAAVLAALEDVENALVAYAEEQDRRDALRDATAAANRAVDLAQSQYGAGMVDFRTVLDAQRSLLSFQDQLAQSQGTTIANLVRLYKTLGGGWQSLAGTGAEPTGAQR